MVEGVLLVRFDEAVEATLALTLLLPLTGTLTPAEKYPGMLIAHFTNLVNFRYNFDPLKTLFGYWRGVLYAYLLSRL